MEIATTVEEQDGVDDLSSCPVTKPMAESRNFSDVSSVSSTASAQNKQSLPAESIKEPKSPHAVEASQSSFDGSDICFDDFAPNKTVTAITSDIEYINENTIDATTSDIEHNKENTIDAATSDIEHNKENTIDAATSDIEHTNENTIDAATGDIEHTNENTIDAAISDIEHSIEDNSDAATSPSKPRKRKKKNKEDYNEYWCSYCGKHFSHKGNMQQHERSHTKERPFSCNLCGMAYTKSSHLLQHRRTHFQTDKARVEAQHVCKLCSRSFLYKNSLTIHLRSHSNVLNFNCDKCHRKFKYKSSFYRHLKVHAGNKSYACDYCQKTFYDGSDLRKHMAIHTGYKTYQCTTCQKRFKLSSKLKLHLKSHTSYKVSNNNKDKIQDRNSQSEMSCTDNEDSVKCDSVENAENKSKEPLKAGSVINVTHSKQGSGESVEPEEIIRHSVEKTVMQNKTEQDCKFENILANKTIKDATEESFSSLEVENETSSNNNHHTSFVENSKESMDNETRTIPRTEEERENLFTENTYEKQPEKPVMENIVSLSNNDNISRNVQDHRKKTVVANTRLKSIIDEYVKKVTTKDKAETVTVKQEVDDTDHSDVLSNTKISTIAAIYVKKEVPDTNVFAEKAVVDGNITIKKEIRDVDFNVQKDTVETDDLRSCASTVDGLNVMDEQLLVKSEVTSDTESIEAFKDQSKEAETARSDGKLLLDSELVLPVVLNLPEDNTDIGENDHNTWGSKPEDKTPEGEVLPFRKEDCTVSQDEYAKLTEAYWKTCRNGNTAESRQKIFRIGCKIQEKGSGKVRYISKYCVIRPTPSMSPNRLKAHVFGLQKGVNKNPVANSVGRPITKLSRTTTTETCSVARNEEKIKSESSREVDNAPHTSARYCYIRPKPIGKAETEAMYCHQTNMKNKSNILCGKTKVSGKSDTVKTVKVKAAKINEVEKIGNPKVAYQAFGDKQNVTIDGKVFETEHDLRDTSTEEKGNSKTDMEESKGIENMNKVDDHQQDCYVVLETKKQVRVPPIKIVKTCRHCRTSFDNKEEFLQHLREHLRPKEFICDDCKQSFSKWRDYSHHKCSDSKKKYDIICAHCDRIFDSEKLLKNHMNGKKKTCQDCNKVFCTAEELNKHKKMHLKYVCKYCSKKLVSSWSLKMHVSRDHRALKCENCGKKFMYAKNLKRHVTQQHINVWFMCESCDIKFVSKESYKIHKKVCTKTSTRRKKVKKHDEFVVEDFDSVENEVHQIDTEEIADGYLDIYEEMVNSRVTENVDEIALSKRDERISASSTSTVTETDTFDLNEEIETITEQDDHIKLSEKDEIMAAVASISSRTEADKFEVTEEIKNVTEQDDHIKLSETDEITAAVASISSRTEADRLTDLTENIFPPKAEDTSLAFDGENETNLKNQKNDIDTNIQRSAESLTIIEHEENNDHGEVMSDLEGEEVDMAKSSRTDEGHCQNETLMQTNKLIVSNALFHKKDNKSKFRLKKVVGNIIMKKPVVSELKEIDNSETENTELKVEPKRTDALKNILGSMKSNMQVIARKMRTRSSAAAETLLNSDDEPIKSNVEKLAQGSKEVAKSLVANFEVEHGDDNKKRQIIGNEIRDNAGIVIVDSSSDIDEETPCQIASPKESIDDAVTIDWTERKSISSDSGSEYLEDDGNYEEEIMDEDLNKETSVDIELETSNKKDAELFDKAEINIGENMLGTSASGNELLDKENRSSDNYNANAKNTYHYNTRKRKSELNSSIKSADKLKRVEIRVSDIFKTDNKKVKKLSNDPTIGNKKYNVASHVDNYDKKAEIIADDSSDDMSSDSGSDEDSEGYEECTEEEVQAMLSSCNKH